MRFRLIVYSFFFIASLAICSCATSSPVGEIAEVGETARIAETVTGVVEERDEVRPQWVEAYLEGGEASVEALPDYEGSRVFIAMEKGEGLSALKKWGSYYSPEQDAARIILKRLYARLSLEGETRLNAQYGDFLTIFMKKIAATPFPPAIFAGDYWMRVSYMREEEAAPGEVEEEAPAEPETSEEYLYFIITLIEKEYFDSEIMRLFSEAASESKEDRQKNSAISRLQGRLFVGF